MMKETPADIEARDRVHAATESQVRSILERVEVLEAEKKECADAIKEVWAEAKGSGFDVPALKKVLAARKKDPDDVANERAMIEMYADLLGVKV